VLTQRKAKKLLMLGESRGRNSLYLSKALAGSLDSPFTVDVQDIRNDSPFDLSPYAAVLLNNAPMIPPQWASTLYEFLNNGGGLIFLAGDRVNPNDLKAPIEKILPARVTGTYKAGVSRKELFIGEIQKQHPIFSVFEAVHYSYFLGTPFSGYLQCTPHETSQVLARLEDGSPLLVEASVGKGRSLLFTSSLNMDWNDLPLKSIFLPFCQQLAKYSVNFEENHNSFAVGEAIPFSQLNPLLGRLLNKISNGAESFSQSWKVQKPSGAKTELNDRDLLQFPFFTLEEPGFYQTTVRNLKNWVAANVDPGESDLRRVEPQKILSAIRKDIRRPQSPSHPLQASEDQRLAWEAQQRMWWFLSLLALAILLVESFLANRYYKGGLD
jgi:Putative glutamine amidotransferase